MNRARAFAAGVALVAATGLLAIAAVPAAAQNEAFVRVVHASPDAPNVDVWVDGETVLTDVPFTAVSDYLTLPAGTYNVQVTATGSTDPVIDADLALEAGTSYTVAATGMLADITATVLTDDRTPADGQAKLRVFHASPSAPAECRGPPAGRAGRRPRRSSQPASCAARSRTPAHTISHSCSIRSSVGPR